jgi:exosome complex RNA-binding protein Csl4
MEEIVAFPGQRICVTNENTIAGAGTYERLGYIYSSLAGIVETKDEEKVRRGRGRFYNFGLLKPLYRTKSSAYGRLAIKQFSQWSEMS